MPFPIDWSMTAKRDALAPPGLFQQRRELEPEVPFGTRRRAALPPPHLVVTATDGEQVGEVVGGQGHQSHQAASQRHRFRRLRGHETMFRAGDPIARAGLLPGTTRRARACSAPGVPRAGRATTTMFLRR